MNFKQSSRGRAVLPLDTFEDLGYFANNPHRL